MDIRQLKTFVEIMAGATDFFGGDRAGLVSWIRARRNEARVLSAELFVDDPRIALLGDQLEAFALAGDLLLKTYDAEEGDLSPSEGLLINEMGLQSPWNPKLSA